MKGLSSKGFHTAAIHGNATEETKEGVKKGAFVLVFFTAELLLESKRWRRLLQTDLYVRRLKAFIVDEAHCVKKW